MFFLKLTEYIYKRITPQPLLPTLRTITPQTLPSITNLKTNPGEFERENGKKR